MRKQLQLLSRRGIDLVLVVATLLTIPAGYGLADGAMVTIDPTNVSVNVGSTTTMSIRVESVTGLYGAEVHLTFDPARLEVVDADGATAGVQIAAGSFLSPDFTAQNVVDNGAGSIDYAISQMSQSHPDPVSGSGVLATITFRGKASGSSNISFANVILSDANGVAISAGSQGGNVTVPGNVTVTVTTTVTVNPTPVTGDILGYHTVRSGETLYCIARAYGVNPFSIASQNGIINPNIIAVGDYLAIPNVPGSLAPGRVCPAQFDGGSPTPPNCRWYHTVVAGENLYRIGLRYGVSMYAIAEANNIANMNLIYPAQSLCIP